MLKKKLVNRGGRRDGVCRAPNVQQAIYSNNNNKKNEKTKKKNAAIAAHGQGKQFTTYYTTAKK